MSIFQACCSAPKMEVLTSGNMARDLSAVICIKIHDVYNKSIDV